LTTRQELRGVCNALRVIPPHNAQAQMVIRQLEAILRRTDEAEARVPLASDPPP
jgi:hypothetical protein